MLDFSLTTSRKFAAYGTGKRYVSGDPEPKWLIRKIAQHSALTTGRTPIPATRMTSQRPVSVTAK